MSHLIRIHNVFKVSCSSSSSAKAFYPLSALQQMTSLCDIFSLNFSSNEASLTEKLSHCEYLANMLRIIGELLCSQ